MRVFCDECCDGSLVAALRAAGHDVRYAAEGDPGREDGDVLARAATEGLLLVTEDKGFAELVVRLFKPCAGLVLVRFPTAVRRLKAGAVVALLALGPEHVMGWTTSVTPAGSRRRRLPVQK